MKGSDPQTGRKDQSPRSKQSPSLIKPEEAEDPFSPMRNSILLLQPGGVWTGRAIKKQSKIQQDKSFYQAQREPPLGVMLRQRRENGL